MFSFLAQTILVASLAVVVYMFARALPRVAEETGLDEKENSFDKFLSHIPLERLDTALHRNAIKFLRKVKNLVLMFDDLLGEYIVNLKQNSISNGEQGVIKEKMEILVNGNNKDSEPPKDDK